MTTTTKKIDLARLRATIKRRNRAFAKLTKAEKRVAIAKDVIKQLKAERLIAMSGVYVEGRSEALDHQDFRIFHTFPYVKDRYRDVDLAEAFEQAPSCNVCALGGLMVCATKRADEIKVGEFNNRQDGLHKYLSRFFAMKQLYMIETAFEGQAILSASHGLDWKTIERCTDFYTKHNDDKPYDFDELFRNRSEASRTLASQRLEAIMKNIIKNNGTFSP